MKIIILTDIIAMCLCVAAVAAYAHGDNNTAGVILTSIGSYYFGRHITTSSGTNKP